MRFGLPAEDLSPPSAGAQPSRQRRSIVRAAVSSLTSPKLALALLIVVLACCLAGVTVLRGRPAWELIFSTLWFNALLVLLAISSATAFFTRIWRRKLTMVSVGMILFHLCFATLLGGVVYNGLFHFHGALRITEGETLPNGQLESYDEFEKGRFFDPSALRGVTTLLRMHRGYVVDGEDKRAAYEVQVKDGAREETQIIFPTRHLVFDGVRFFPSKEGYSVLVVMNDKGGQVIYGAHVPLQSLRQPDGGYLYATGTWEGPAALPFPSEPERPTMGLQLFFRPNAVVERAGEVTFDLWPLDGHTGGEPLRSTAIPVGGSFDAGDFTLTPREIRYWVGMSVRYDPGLNIALGSLVAGLLGMALTFVGRVRQGASRRRVA